MKSTAPEQATQPPDTEGTASKPKKPHAKKTAPAIHLAGGVPKSKPNVPRKQVANVDAPTPTSDKEVAGVAADYVTVVANIEAMDTTPTMEPEKAVATTDAAPLKANVPETLSVKEVGPDDAAKAAGMEVGKPNQFSALSAMTSDTPPAASAEPGVAVAGTVVTDSTTSTDPAPADATPPNVVVAEPEGAQAVAATDEVPAAFEIECQAIRRRIVAHEISYAMGWYPIADAVADLKRRYTGRLQNLAVGIGDAIGRSERFVYLLLKIADHPAELRARVREVGMGDDQGRLVQLTSLAGEDRDRALEAFGEGGATAFDAAIQGTDKLAERAKRDPAFAALLEQFAHPEESLGGIAEAAPSAPVPEPLTKQYPELTGMTYGDVLRHVSSPDPDEDNAPSKKGGKSKPKQRFSEGFDVDVAEEREVGLRKARFLLTVKKVYDADGKAIDGASVTIMVVDKTL